MSPYCETDFTMFYVQGKELLKTEHIHHWVEVVATMIYIAFVNYMGQILLDEVIRVSIKTKRTAFGEPQCLQE